MITKTLASHGVGVGTLLTIYAKNRYQVRQRAMLALITSGVTELQRHAQELTATTAEWMPWNYRDTLTP
jgi:hypothetical protein